MLLDVSSHADQMGVTLGPAIQVERDPAGGTTLRTAGSRLSFSNRGLPLQIDAMDVVTTAANTRAATLPQISWEPLWNIPLKIEGMPDPADTVTVFPGLLVYDDDGVPTRIFCRACTRCRSRRCRWSGTFCRSTTTRSRRGNCIPCSRCRSG